MASPTRLLKVRRKLAQVNKAKVKKSYVRNHGTTVADLPLNVPNANEIAQKAKKNSK